MSATLQVLMGTGTNQMADLPLLVGEILTFESAAALTTAAADVDELGGLNAEMVGPAPASRQLEVQFALGDLVHDARHEVRLIPVGGDRMALNFRQRSQAAIALRELAAQHATQGSLPAAPVELQDITAFLTPIEAEDAGVVLLIGDTLTFDSSAAASAFIQEVQVDGGALVEALGADTPPSGRVALGLSLAGQNSSHRHTALALQSGDDQVGLVFEDPDGLITDLRRLASGAAPVAELNASDIAIEMFPDSTTDADEEEVSIEMVPVQPAPAGPRVDLGGGDLLLELSADDAIAAALAEMEGSAPRPSKAPQAPSPEPVAARAPVREAASQLPSPMPEESSAMYAGGIVNPTTPKEFLAYRLATPIDPRTSKQMSALELLVGLNMIRASGELILTSPRARFEVPFLDGTFFATEDEIDLFFQAALMPAGRFAVMEKSSHNVVVGRTKREPRPLSFITLRAILAGVNKEQLSTGLNAIKNRYPKTMINVNYTRLGVSLERKEKLFLAQSTNGKQTIAETIQNSPLSSPEAVCLIYICIIYDIIELLDAPKT
ncbi:MAG: hypothetical protein ABIJ09_05865 [Pseudomonadota bacterium]